MTVETVLRRLKECPLIASVQASPGSPADNPDVLLRLARASVNQGVKVLRLEGVKNIRVIKPGLPIPTIGLIKRKYQDSDVYITPTAQDADALIELHCEIIAFDGTERARPKGNTVAMMAAHIKKRKKLAMADCDTVASAIAAQASGVDLISTTLAGYTPDRPATIGPDLEVLRQIIQAVTIPVLAEGRFSQRWEIEAALRMGAVGVVVGGALNDPVKQTKSLQPEILAEGLIGAVDIGGTWLRFATFTPDWKMNTMDRTPYPKTREARLAWIKAHVIEMGVTRVGVGTGGIVDPWSGEVWTAKEYLMPDHAGIKFTEQTLGVPTYAFGDGHATAWGHACLPAFAGRRVATLALGTGVGCGFVREGKIWAGRRGEYPRINDLPAAGGQTYEGLLGGIHLTREPTEEQKSQAIVALKGAIQAVRDLYFPDDILIAGSVGLSPWLAPHVAELGAITSPLDHDAGIFGAAALALYPTWR